MYVHGQSSEFAIYLGPKVRASGFPCSQVMLIALRRPPRRASSGSRLALHRRRRDILGMSTRERLPDCRRSIAQCRYWWRCQRSGRGPSCMGSRRRRTVPSVLIYTMILLQEAFQSGCPTVSERSTASSFRCDGVSIRE